MKFLFILPLLLSFTNGPVGTKKDLIDLEILYGRDDRLDVDKYEDQRFVDFSNSVAGMVASYKLKKNNQGNYNIRNTPLVYQNFCEDVPFVNQNTLPKCTGFLVAPNILITAGHCVDSKYECENNNWVFNYKESKTEISASNVYKCEEILVSKNIKSFGVVQDYAILKLNKNVSGYRPLKLRQKGRVKLGTELVVIGHPLGLPMKIADNGQVVPFSIVNFTNPLHFYKISKNTFLTNLDTFVGNSGSPVFNKKSGEVEGLLIQGGEDFIETDEGCISNYKSKSKTFLAEERVFRINKIKELKSILKSDSKKSE